MIDHYRSVFFLLRAIDGCLFDMITGMMAKEAELEGTRLTDFRNRIQGIKDICIRLEIESALERIARIETAMHSPYQCHFAAMRNHIRTLRENVEDNLMQRIFWYIPQSKVEHLLTQKEALLFRNGPELQQAQNEFFEAEQCFGLERWTGCMFHASRLAELCLRTMGRHLIGDKIGNRSIELVDWKPMLQALEPIIEEKLKKFESDPRTEERERANRFFTDVRSHLAFFKSVRDEVSHARASYDEGQAISALRRVKDFSKLMAEGMI